MEGILLSPNPDHHQSISRNKQIRSSKNCNYRGGSFISRSSENFIPPSSNIHGGILFGSSPYMYSSFPSSSLSILGHHHQQQQQPPLLPLPVPSRIYSSFPTAARNNKPILQFSPSSSNNNNRKNKIRTRDQDLTPKKSKSSINHIISLPDSRSKTTRSRGGGEASSTDMLISSTNRLGPEPRDIPKEVSGVLKPVVTSSMEGVEVEVVEEEELSVSGSIFSLAPPPSSLPLPKFSVTPKLRCNVEAGAGGIDAGATDNLRRLLRLR